MPKPTGDHFPERELMSVLSDLLGFDHYTTARGSTVRRDFLEGLADALGVPSSRALATKDDVLAACYEAAVGVPMPEDRKSPGGTVTNRVLQEIVDGAILQIPDLGDIELPETTGATLFDDVEDPVEEEFDPEEMSDERDRQLKELVIRQGQDKFRTAVLEAYSGRCAISGFDAPEALHAAHIVPYQGPASNKVSNGIAMRADLHVLFDRGAIAVHEESHLVLLRPTLAATRYEGLAGSKLRLPKRAVDRPAFAALRNHREWAGL